MYKSMFLIVIGAGMEPSAVQPVTGWVFSDGDYTFGLARRDKKGWDLFDLRTGMMCGSVGRKGDAHKKVEEIIPSLEYVYQHIQKGDRIDRANEMILRGYDVLGIPRPF